MTSLKTSIKNITYLSDIGCLEIQGASLLGDHLTFHQPMGGMFLWAKFKYAMDTTQWLQKTIRNGVVFVPGEFFYCEEPDHCTLRMSYVSTTEENLIEAVKRLKISLN
ncbi:transcriptional regulator [Klebsiella pneumoniae]|nr:transcriptional regulator [Klebsiella pneumoniae]